ncbi:MAG: translocation/assembly module TamB domain-containing protein, partial [Xanthomonadales bacterium]|nr:translocation/assembly module TamB domain-containing protein [Xanthomonadales bacterium]
LNDTEDGLFISSKNNQILGQLKNQSFEFSGQLEYSNKQLQADQLMLNLGENTLQVNGIISAEQVDMSVSLDWSDLTLLDADLNGQLAGSLTIAGSHKKPEFQAKMQAQNLKFHDIQVKQLALNSQGVWQQDIQTSIKINDLALKDRLVDQLTIKQQGWLKEHQIDIDAEHDGLHQQANLTGAYNLTSHDWQGVLQQHQLSVPSGENIRLIKPVSVQWANNSINIDLACWVGQAEGTLCLNLKQTSQQMTADLTVDALSLVPFQMFLPSTLEVTGLANGSAKLALINNVLRMESNLEINDGVVKIWQSDTQKNEVIISKLLLAASSNQDGSTMLLDFATSDNDTLTGKVHITYGAQRQWLIDGTINGTIINTAAIKTLTSEISELEGRILLEAKIKGQLKQPEIQLNFSQPNGYMSLSRMGTVIEQLNLQVNTSTSKNPNYHIKIIGQNLANINQGQFTSEGVLTITPEKNNKNQWNYKGLLSGKNFMIFNTPELKLHVSPQLNILANQQTMSIQGDLIFDQGRVVVEQLPPESVANSNDLVIIRNENTGETTAYPITFDINTIIANKLELDVIGLQALLSGSMHLKQLKDQPIVAKGTLNLEEGKYEVYGQKLDINTGEMIFNGSVDNPQLNVKASRKSLDGNVIAGVQLGGTVNNLQSKLFSEPTLSDIEILSYIMTGNGINQAGSINGEQLKQTAILLGLNQGAPVFRQIQNTFGIDVLTVKEAAKAEDTVIEAGKKVNDKLYIAYNHGIFNRLGFWVLKYKLNEFLNLQTTQGEDQSIELVYTRKAKTKKRN